ncbi:hypothetical protein OF83DRAFT_1044531, partial [Amylostereum chailletii]
LLLLLRVELQDKNIPHRTRARQLVLEYWDDFFQKVKHDLFHAEGRVSCTADIWSDSKRASYIAITGHWIGSRPNG